MAEANESVNPALTIESLPDSQIASKPAGQPYEQAGESSVTLKAVEELIQKQFQSLKDTRLGKMESQLNDLEGAVAKYEALQSQGLSKDQALNQMQGDRELQDIKAKLDSVLGGNKAVPSPGGGEKSWGERQQAILDNAGIDKNDSRIVELLRTSKSKQGFLADLEAKTFEWKQSDVNKPQPSASTVASTIPSVPSGDGSYTVDKYKTDMLAAQGKPDEVKRIKAAARADGVPVDNIAFI